MSGCESWTIKKIESKNRCFWTVILEKILENRSDSKEIKPVNPKGNQSWIFIGRTDAEAEAPTLWPPHAKNGLIGKDPAAGKAWWQEEKRMTGDWMVGWHHQLDRHESEQATGVGDGQGSLVCRSPWGHKESDMTEWLNWTESLSPPTKCNHYSDVYHYINLAFYENLKTKAFVYLAFSPSFSWMFYSWNSSIS